MDIFKNVSLALHTTMKIGGPAKMLTTVNKEEELVDAIRFAKEQKLKVISLGEGSNIIFKDTGFDGLVILNRIKGYSIEPSGLVEVCSGENWDNLVNEAVSKGLCGIESTSYIPGTAGATPINNVGAYGQEIKDSLVSVRAYDTSNQTFVEFNNSECDFSYRNSRFKSYDWGKYIITKINLKLMPIPDNYIVPEYQSVIDKLKADNVTEPKPADVRIAVKSLRAYKLPDPSKLANTGSFFKNPIVPKVKADELLSLFPSLPIYPLNDGKVKLAGAWLIDNAGLKDFRQNGMWVYDKQALVLVNESAKSFGDLEAIYKHIIDVVYQKYGVELTPEPEII